MKPPAAAPPGLLVVGLLCRDDALADESAAILASRFGPVDARSPVIPFDFTDYYEPEMGKNLRRSWSSFARPVAPECLADIKLATGELERVLARRHGVSAEATQDRSSAAPRRVVNLDPGVLTLHNFVLASTKDFAHRVCLRGGVWAELTLVFHSGRYEPLPWTYPDYRSPACLSFLLAARERLLAHRVR